MTFEEMYTEEKKKRLAEEINKKYETFFMKHSPISLDEFLGLKATKKISDKRLLL